jgi:3-phytase
MMKPPFCLSVITLLIIVTGCADQNNIPTVIIASSSTVPVGSADGVAIWVNHAVPSQSTVIGAIPSSGVAVFSLEGKVLQKIQFEEGGAGEVDVRDNFKLNGENISVAAGGVKSTYTIFVYKIDPATGRLNNILTDPPKTAIRPYGSCLYQNRDDNKLYLFVTSKQGIIEQYEISDNGNSMVIAELIRTLKLDHGPDNVVEACVADDDLGYLYVAQENMCNIWRYNAKPDADQNHILINNAKISEGDNVEGLAIYPTSKTDGYLIASIQKSWKYKVYTRKYPNKLIGTFELQTAEGNGIIESHDCIEVTGVGLGNLFPNGLFVTQNANNPDGFHYQMVRWDLIKNSLGLK